MTGIDVLVGVQKLGRWIVGLLQPGATQRRRHEFLFDLVQARQRAHVLHTRLIEIVENPTWRDALRANNNENVFRISSNLELRHDDAASQTAYHIAAYIAQSAKVHEGARPMYYPGRHVFAVPDALSEVDRALQDIQLLWIDRVSIAQHMVVETTGLWTRTRLATKAEFDEAVQSGALLSRAVTPIRRVLSGNLESGSSISLGLIKVAARLDALIRALDEVISLGPSLTASGSRWRRPFFGADYE